MTNLTANTSYSVTAVAINTCCGAGPLVSNVKMTMTNNEPPIRIYTSVATGSQSLTQMTHWFRPGDLDDDPNVTWFKTMSKT